MYHDIKPKLWGLLKMPRKIRAAAIFYDLTPNHETPARCGAAITCRLPKIGDPSFFVCGCVLSVLVCDVQHPSESFICLEISLFMDVGECPCWLVV